MVDDRVEDRARREGGAGVVEVRDVLDARRLGPHLLEVDHRAKRMYAQPDGARDDAGEAPVARGAARRGAARGLGEVRREAQGRRQAARARAGGEALRPGLVRRARPLRAPSRVELRDARPAALRRRGRHRLRDDLRPPGLRLQPGLHRLRRLAQRGVRREDLQGDGPGGEVRLPADRDQRLGRRADPGGRRLARGLRGDLLAQRAELGRDPADLARHGPVRGRRRLLACDDRLHADGRGHARTCSSPAPTS